MAVDEPAGIIETLNGDEVALGPRAVHLAARVHTAWVWIGGLEVLRLAHLVGLGLCVVALLVPRLGTGLANAHDVRRSLRCGDAGMTYKHWVLSIDKLAWLHE